MIKAIAFDLWGCLLRENDIEMTSQEEILEKEFGNLNSDEKYFSWATQALPFSEEEIKSILANLWPKLYSLREEWIFEKILEKYPLMIFAVASNHISLVRESLKHLWILEEFKVILICTHKGIEDIGKIATRSIGWRIGMESQRQINTCDEKICLLDWFPAHELGVVCQDVGDYPLGWYESVLWVGRTNEWNHFLACDGVWPWQCGGERRHVRV